MLQAAGDKRRVVFRLDLDVDPQAAKRLRDLGQEAARAQKRIRDESQETGRRIKDETQQQERAQKKAADDELRRRRDLRREIEKEAAAQDRASEKAAREEQRRQRELASAQKKASDDDLRRRREVRREIERESREQDRQREKSARDEMRRQRELARESERTERDRTRVLSAAHKERQRMAREAASDAERQDKERTRAMERAEKERTRVVADAARERASAEQRRVIANRSLAEGLTRATEGVIHLGRAFAMMGLVGERDMQKLLQTLIKAQIVMDGFRGGIATWMGLTKAAAAYRAVVATLPAFSMAAPLAGAGGAVGLTAGAGLAAAVGGTAGGYAAFDFARQAGRYGIGGGAAPGSYTNWMGGKIADLRIWASRWSGGMQDDPTYANAARAEDRTARMFGAYRAQRAARERRMAERAAIIGGVHAAADMGIVRAGMQSRGGRAGLAGDLGAARGSRVEAEAQLGVAEVNAGFGGENAEEFTQRALDLRQQILRLREQEMQLTLAQKDEEIAGAREVLDLRQREYDAAKANAEQQQQRLMSAQERFGAMDPAQQAAALDAARRVAAGQGGRADIEAIRGLGLAGAEQAVRTFDMEAAVAAGFDELATLFGDRQAAFAAERRAEELKVAVETQNAVTIKLEADREQLRQTMEAAMKPILDDIIDNMNRATAQALERMQSDARHAELERAAGVPAG